MLPQPRTQGILDPQPALIVKAASIDFFISLIPFTTQFFFLDYGKFCCHSLIATVEKACYVYLYFLWELGCGQIGRVILDH